MKLSASGFDGGWNPDNNIECQDSSDDACGSKLSDTFVTVYDTDHDLIDNALKIQPTKGIALRLYDEDKVLIKRPCADCEGFIVRQRKNVRMLAFIFFFQIVL